MYYYLRARVETFPLTYHISGSTFDVRANRIIHSTSNNLARIYRFRYFALTVTLKAIRERDSKRKREILMTDKGGWRQRDTADGLKRFKGDTLFVCCQWSFSLWDWQVDWQAKPPMKPGDTPGWHWDHFKSYLSLRWCLVLSFNLCESADSCHMCCCLSLSVIVFRSPIKKKQVKLTIKHVWQSG